MTETRVRTLHGSGSALDAIYAMARLSENDAGKVVLDVKDCKEIRLALDMHNLDSERYGYEKGFNEAMYFLRCKPWYKRIRL